jgi:glycosidase
MPRLASLILAATLTVAAAPPVALADAPLALRGAGGDAWTFNKFIDGVVTDGPCDEIVVTSPSGSVRAERSGDRFFAMVSLREGANALRAICRAGGIERGVSASQHWTVRIDDAPKAWTRAGVTSTGLILDAGRSQMAPARAAPIIRYEWRARAGNPAPLHTVDGDSLDMKSAMGRRLALRPPGADGEYYVTLRVTDALGRADEAVATFRVRHGQPESIDLLREHPSWVDDAVVYGVVPFFFGPRGFADVTSRLDAIAGLGATVLWLSPIAQSAPGDFGYAVTDHFALRETFGSEEELRALVAAAHARGLRVILDFVPNHASDKHPYYVDAVRKGTASPYFDFFDRGASGEVTHYFDWPHLKNLSFDSPEVRRYIIEAFLRWIRDFDVDGFRVDVGWGVRERAPEFWPRWREELKRIKPDLLLLAEASARDPYYVAHGFDAAYDWTHKLGEWAWRDAFEDRSHTAARLRAALADAGASLDSDTLVFRFLNNNDTGARFITRFGIARYRAAATMLFTLPGLPLIYTGDEVGAAYEPYAEGPPITWADAHGLVEHYKKLTALRRAHPALRSRKMQLVDTSQPDTVLAYLRPARASEDGLLVLINYADAPAAAALSSTDALAAVIGGGTLVDVLNGETLAVTPAAPVVHLPPFSARMLRRADRPAG